MAKHCEKELPEGYEEALVIDATNKKLGFCLNAIAIVVAAVVITVAVLFLRPNFKEVTFVHSVLFFVGVLTYLIAHELTHGVVYKALTKEKLTFGFTMTVAFCGVPDVYVYKKAAMLALLAPFTVFTLLFGGLALFLPDPLTQFMFSVMLGVHIGGCSGDLYNTFLYLFRFKDPQTLMRDTGPKQTFYVKRQ